MILSESNLAIREKLAKYSNTNPDDWFLCLKARYGMAASFKAIRSELGSGEVITTPYTCITSVNPIIVADLKPVYADIDPQTLSITGADKLVNKRTRAIVVQHTLGIINPEIQNIGKICKDTGMDPKKLFKPTADVCNWASVQMLPVGGSIAYLMWFNSYLEQVGTDLRYGLFDFTFIKFPMWLVLVAYYLFMSRGQKLKDASIAAIAEDDKPARYTPEQEKVIVGIFFLNVILMVIASMTKIIAPYLVSLFFAAVIVGRGYLSEKEAFQSISWQTVFLVAGTLPLATAINSSGMSDWIVSLVQAAFPSMTNPVVLATAFAVLSMVVTQFMSNLAVWAVFGPIAASMAVSMGMDPRLVLAGVSVGSIICFATPMAAPAPAYAYSAAGFTMKEYIKMGWFPCVLMTIVFVLWAPLVLNWLY